MKRKTQQNPPPRPQGGMNDAQKHSRRPRPLTVLMILLIIACLLVNTACAYDIFGRTPVPATGTEPADPETQALIEENKALIDEQAAEEAARKKDGSIGFVPSPDASKEGSYDIVVVDEDSAMEALVAMQGELGISDVKREYRCVKTDHNDFRDIYTMQQYYDGLEVVGGELKMKVDPSGNVVYVSGSHHPIGNLDTSTSYSENQARDILVRYLKQNYQVSDPDIDFNGKKVFLNQNTPTVIYAFNVGFNTFFVDGNNGTVFQMESSLRTIDTSFRLKGEEETWTLTVAVDGENNYRLASENQNISIYDTGNADGSFLSQGAFDTRILEPYYNTPYRFTAEDQSALNVYAVDTLVNMEITYGIFGEKFNWYGLTGDGNQHLPVFVYFENWSNAACCGNSFILMGRRRSKPNYSAQLEVLAHEFMHGVLNSKCRLGEGTVANSEASAINEGLADVFGSFTKSFYTNKEDWQIGDLRNAKTPTSISVYSQYVVGSSDCHDGTYLVSHPAYLMTQGIDGDESKKIDMDTLSNLYFNMTDGMVANETFQGLRLRVETEAITSNLSDKQIECVMDAMDKVEIPLSYQYALTPDATISFSDNRGNPVNTGELILRKSGSTDVAFRDHVDSLGKIALNDRLAPGIYYGEFRVSDDTSATIFSLAINDCVNEHDPYKDKAVVIVESTYISIVLDVSGSMDGTPVETAKNAAISLVETVHESAPWARINVITYSDDVSLLVGNNNDVMELTSAINRLGSGGGTNMYDGLKTGYLALKNGTNRMVFIMSDGMPNRGIDENGDYQSPILSLARDLRNSGTTIFSFGFFHSLSGSELTAGQSLMAGIASQNYSYNVRTLSDLNGAFTFIASQLANIGNTVHIEVHCPVDVRITYNGETLSSDKRDRNLSTSFGLITFEGEDDDVKIVNLQAGPDYDICLVGTDKGTMDYSIAFSDDSGEYVDERIFKDVPLTKSTVISTGAKQEKSTELRVDTDGDGAAEYVYTAGANKEAKKKNAVNPRIFVIIAASAIALLLIFIQIMLMVKRAKKPRSCPTCGAQRVKGANNCWNCGAKLPKVSILFPEKVRRKPQTRRAILTKLIVSVVALGILWGGIALYVSAPTKVYRNLRQGKYTTAARLYDQNVEGETISERVLSLMTSSYLSRLNRQMKEGKASKEAVVSVCQAVYQFDIGSASEKAETALNAMGVELKKAPEKPAPEDGNLSEQDADADESDASSKFKLGGLFN